MDWDLLRRAEFPIAERWAYFDHAAVAPLPRRAASALAAWAADVRDHGLIHWPDWERRLDRLRDRFARWLSAHSDEIAFIPSTTHGIGLIAETFPWQAGDNVVSPADEYPSNVYPWMNLESRGVALRRVPTREGRIWVEDLESACDARTRVLAISHVEFGSGFRNDLDALCRLTRRRGIALFVDAIQGLGPHVIDVRATPIDFLAADGHKWLLGPEGAGVLYVRRDWIERLRPMLVGWHSVRTRDFAVVDFALKPNAQRWEGGSYLMPGLQALSASLEVLEAAGKEAVSARILERADRVRELALARGWSVVGTPRPEDRSAIVSLSKEGIEPGRAVARLRRLGVVASHRAGRLRLSPHIYNDANDLERLGAALDAAGGE